MSFTKDDLPTRKVTIGLVAQGLSWLVVWGLGQLGPQWVMPPQGAIALTAVFSGAAMYLTSDHPKPRAEEPPEQPEWATMTERQWAVWRHILDTEPDPPGWPPAPAHPRGRHHQAPEPARG